MGNEKQTDIVEQKYFIGIMLLITTSPVFLHEVVLRFSLLPQFVGNVVRQLAQ